ncbi:MAG: cobalamin-dependent protein [Desulfobacteraceae bacterium]|jgi:radical SAM superfamily enzyme YgiQ (UPF0313 family)/ubiquinone/menaquinone biosynthesis C-methylase UbiE
MKILLVNPPYSTEERYGKDLGKFGPLNEPLGLAYIAATLEKHGHGVSICDAPALGVTAKGICELIGEGAYDLVGVTMLTPMYARSVEVVKSVREAFSQIKIVVGGPHPTILPSETLTENKEIDFAVIGEGELTLLNLVETLESGKDPGEMPGIAYRKEGRVIISQPAEMVANLDDLPMPARHLLPMHAYQMTKSRSQSGHAFTVSVARGCPFNCAFCCRIFGRKARHHSVERITSEISILLDKYGAREINLEADTLTLNKRFIESLCDGIIQSGLNRKITWTCESRVDTVNEDILRKMKEAGCWQISYGVETGSQRLLQVIHKDITLEQIEKTFAITKKMGITIRAFYMLGIPTETREESLKTISFAKKLDARWSQFTLFTPFPGTELYDLAVREEGMKSRNWADYKTHGGWTEGTLAYVPKGRTVEEMKKLQKRAYAAVYLRPRVILRFLRDIDSIKKIREYAVGFWVLLKTIRPSSNNHSKAVRIEAEDLERFARGVYVDSPVYFSSNRFIRFLNWKKLDMVRSLFLLEARDWALDFGCGNGVMLPTLSRLFQKVCGIDLHTTAASKMRNEYGLDNVFLATADGFRLPFKNNAFSVVVATSALEHFKDLDGAVSEIARVVKPGGSLLFLSPTENLFYRFGRWVFRYKKPEDHYHSAKEIQLVLDRYFSSEIERYFPAGFLPFISAYQFGRFRRVSH